MTVNFYHTGTIMLQGSEASVSSVQDNLGEGGRTGTHRVVEGGKTGTHREGEGDRTG